MSENQNLPAAGAASTAEASPVAPPATRGLVHPVTFIDLTQGVAAYLQSLKSGKGLAKGTIGLLGATVIGISCVAPAYTLSGALGPSAAAVGWQVPAIMLIGFLPMLLTAFGYKELNKVMPDSGTSFTWGVRAFGPYLGWMSGWGLIIAMIVVLSNLAGIAVDFFYLAVSQMGFGPETAEFIAGLKDNVAVNVITCLIFVALATMVSYRDMQATQRLQVILVSLQLLVFVGFGAMMFYRAYVTGAAPHFSPVELSWFNPFAVESFGALAAGISVSLFIFWGWDVTLTINEETKDPETTPGRAAALTVVSVVLVYLFVSVGAMAYAGIGTEGLGLANEEIADNVFFALANPVMGGAAILVSLTVLISSAASLQSTFMGPARTLLAMGHYGAISKRFATIHPRFFTPSVATIDSAIVTSVFYGVMRVVSNSVLWDTVATLGLVVMVYYRITQPAFFLGQTGLGKGLAGDEKEKDFALS